MSSSTGHPTPRHDRVFRAIWAGQTASLFGDQVTGLALPWLILLQTHSPLAALGLVASVAANLVLDGAVALGFVLTGTANTLVTPPMLRGRVNAVSTIYSSALRGVAALGAGALAASGNPLPVFLALAGCCRVAAAIARGRRSASLR